MLIVAFPRRPDIVAAAWGIMAFGDGAATLVGTRVKSRPIRWNPDKTIAGSAAFIVAGAVAGAALAWWTRPAVSPVPPLLFTLAAPALAAVAAAGVESIRVRLDDNISVPITAAIVLGGLALVDGASWAAARAALPSALAYAVLVNVPVAALGWRAGTVTPSGAVVGAAIGIAVFAGAGPAGWALLFASFLAATASTRLGLKRKSVLGIAESRGGRRGPGNAVANTGLAAFVAIVAAFSPYREAALLAMTAALVAGASDTVASEIGKAWGAAHLLVPETDARAGRHVRRGVARGDRGRRDRRSRPRGARDGARSRQGKRPLVCHDRGDRGVVRGELARLDARGVRNARQRYAQLHQHGPVGGVRRRAGLAGGAMSPRSRAGLYLEFARPFTLFAPALGMASGGATAIGAAPREPWSVWLLIYPLVGAVMAATLNAASNGLNQIYDLDIDAVNKPGRPLPSGRMTIRDAWAFTIAAFAAAWLLAWVIAPGGRHECFWLVVAATIITTLYSVPPFRTKRLGLWANLTVAIPRGALLKVAGWSSVKTVMGVEPWFIGTIFGLFLLGATTTKDFADMEGDARGGCRTLPIQFGVRRAAWMISPSFVVPFLLIPVGAWTGILTGRFWLLQALGAVMTLYGVYVCYLMLRRPEDLAVEENHVSWAHMYRMMFVAQVGFALAYLL